MDPDTQEPYDTLTPVAVDWCRAVNSSANKVSEIIDNNDDKVLWSSVIIDDTTVLHVEHIYVCLALK